MEFPEDGGFYKKQGTLWRKSLAKLRLAAMITLEQCTSRLLTEGYEFAITTQGKMVGLPLKYVPGVILDRGTVNPESTQKTGLYCRTTGDGMSGLGTASRL